VARKSSRVRLSVLGLLVGCTLLACASEPPPHVVVVVIDTLRADRLGLYGNERGLTPFMDSLAERGVVFTRATAPSSWTIPSVATLLTSRHASQHRVVRFESVLDDSEVTLAERLRDAGWVTGGFTANFRLMEKYGYAQGFSDWEVVWYFGKTRAPALHKQVFSWLARVREERPDAPLLLYVHYLEPHTPYEPPKRFRRQFARPQDHEQTPEHLNRAVTEFRWGEIDVEETARLAALYDAEVAASDAALRALFEALERHGVLDRAYVVVTSDHGEEFDEHGSFLHGRALYEESIRVPLLLVPPAHATRLQGIAVDDDVSLIDVAPTLLELLGLPPEPRFEGRSLLARIGGEERGGDVRVELPQMNDKDARLHSAGLIRGSLKLLLDPSGRPALYDLEADPAELDPDPSEHADARAALLRAHEDGSRILTGTEIRDPETRPLEDEERERLEAIGYVAD
jgi:arylsulfatase